MVLGSKDKVELVYTPFHYAPRKAGPAFAFFINLLGSAATEVHLENAKSGSCHSARAPRQTPGLSEEERLRVIDLSTEMHLSPTRIATRMKIARSTMYHMDVAEKES